MQECLSIGFGLTDEPEGTDREGFNELLKNIVEDGLSIGAFDRTTNEIVGVCFNKLHVSDCFPCVVSNFANFSINYGMFKQCCRLRLKETV